MISEYFILSHDKRIREIELFRIPEYNGLAGKNRNPIYNSFEEATIVQIKTDKTSVFPDVLNNQLFLVTEPVKNLFHNYLPDFEYKMFYAMDSKNRKMERYFYPLLPEKEGLVLQEQSTRSDKNPMVYREKIGNQHIIQDSNTKQNIIVVSLAVAEALLRRNLNGISLTRVKLI